jgi:predicted flap endonuclease-1-like 5' DNA nuclease
VEVCPVDAITMTEKRGVVSYDRSEMIVKYMKHVFMAKIKAIEGIGATYAKKLGNAGIQTTIDLLEAGATKKGRGKLAKKTGIPTKTILEWINRADLFRIKGIGEEYSDLLEEAGVDTVIELAKRNPKHLYTTLVKVNEEKKLVQKLPALNVVRGWIEQAKKLPRKVEY